MQGFNNIRDFQDEDGNTNKVIVERYNNTFDKPVLEKSVVIIPDGEYIFIPKKEKQGVRRVTVLEFVEDKIGNPTEVKVRFKDDNQIKNLGISELDSIN